MSTRLARFIVTACVVVSACAPAGETETAQSADAAAKAIEPAPATQSEVEKNAQDLVALLRAGDGAATGNAYATDATFINARGKIDGSEAIAAFWTEALQSGAGKSLTLEPVKWGASGDLAYSLHRYSGGITAPSGYVLAVTQRQPDGTFKVVTQVSMPDMPAKQ
jgi:ketosteroid isomerase-like protein